MYTVELILLNDKYEADEWRKVALVIAKRVGGITGFSLSIVFQENIIRFFAHTKRDITSLSNGLDGMLIRPVSPDQAIWEIPENAKSQSFLKVPTGGNVIDIRQDYKVKTGKTLDILRLDVQRLGSKMASKMTAVLSLGSEKYVSKIQLSLFPSHLLALDFMENTSYIKTTMPKYLSLEKTLHVLQTFPDNALFSVPAFPYSTKDYYLHLSSYEFDKHSFIVGASGSGKSKLIQLFVDRLSLQAGARQNYRIVVIDPHASLENDLRHLADTRIVNLGNESTQLFPEENTDMSAATELTTTLFKSLMGAQESPRLERVLRFSIYVLLCAQIMTLQNLKEFLTQLEFRTRVLKHVDGFVPQNLLQFFATDFNEIKTQHYNEAISPIISLVDELQLQPSLVGESAQGLSSLVQANFLTVFSLNKMSMGEKAVKIVAGLLIQQMFLLAQSRVTPQRLILIIDEVSVVQNPAIASILAEARKFNLSIILTQQYFGQIDKNLRNAILGNTVNYYVFRVSNEDAAELADNIVFEIPPEVLLQTKEKGLDEAGTKAAIMTGLSPREAIVRVSANGQMLPGIKVRTVDITNDPGRQVAFASTPDLSPPKLQKLPSKMMLDAPALSEDLKPLLGAAEAAAEQEFKDYSGGSLIAPMGDSFNPEKDPFFMYEAPKQESDMDRTTSAPAQPLDASHIAHVAVGSVMGVDRPVPAVINLQQVLAQQSSARENVVINDKQEREN